jgi:hypothetical protein
VNIVAGDGFFDQQFIVRLGFVNATFVLDMWHLLDSGLEQSFGKAGFLKLKGHLVKMVKSQSEYEFENTFRAAKELLESYQLRDRELESKLAYFASQRTSYASYCLAEIPGNRGLHGSACSEQNHSSVLSYLNDGDSKGNSYREHPITLIKDLLQRQKRYVIRKDEALFGFTQKMRVETDRLKNSPATKENIDLLQASTKLCLPTYERYKKFSLRAEQELVLNSMATDPITNVTCYSVASAKYPDAPPRIFATADARCTCKDRCMELDMCAHEIKVRGGFDEALFLPRHMARECVRGSLTTPVPAIGNVDAMIGYESESIECSALFSTMNISSIDDEGMVCAIDGIGDFNLFSGGPGHSSATVTAMYEQPPPGYLPDTNSKVKPMSQKRMNQIFTTASQMYSGLTEDEQFQLTKVALDVQDMLTLRACQSMEASTSTGMTALIPTGNRLMKEAKNRKKARKEVRAEVYTKKLKTSVQGMGLSQTIVGEQHDLQVNGKNARIHCSFCDEDHAVPHCPQRTYWITQKFHEYDLSTNNDNESKLRSVIKHSMPTVTHSTESVFGKIERSLMSKNFIIHKAFHVKGMPNNQIESMNFCVDFLGKDGEVLVCSSGMWISGGLMNSLITHNNVKKKYIYDATTVHKPGMRQRGTVTISTHDKKDSSGGNEQEEPHQMTYDYDKPYQCENNNDCQSITSQKSSSCCLSSIADPFDQNDDGTSTEPIHVGDEIQFYKSPFAWGDERGLVRAEVLAIDPNDSCPLVLSNQYAIAKDGFQQIQRVKVKTPGDQVGFWRLLSDFTIQQEGSTLDAGIQANYLQTREFGDIMSRRTSLVRELAENEQFCPMDMMVEFQTTEMGQK